MYGKTKMLLIVEFLIFNPHDYSHNAFIGVQTVAFTFGGQLP